MVGVSLKTIGTQRSGCANLANGRAVVSFHFGLPPAELMARVRGCGARILSSATTIDEAHWLEAHGVDAVIAQGLEAGGHRGIFLSEDLATQDLEEPG